MESDTMELLRLMLAHLRPRLQGRDEEWQALARQRQETLASPPGTHGGGGAPPGAAHFFLGLQMGLDLGKLNYLREE